ncbi:MAG: response regulator transcription factor [Glaciecola sp.]|jgi:DNA-binding NarL/FixJ family response regulator|nr:response regulator transcription factor [Glaciecola sp.]MDG1814610.1 response regulator transcription factor [Glaciecola sp.]MDG2099406.1 response regulator transcription factor [Glaciecola sp.]
MQAELTGTSVSTALIADDHPLFRSALIQALTPIFAQHIAQTSDLNTTLEYLTAYPDTDIVFLDLNMPGNDGLSGLITGVHQFPNTLFVIVSALENPTVMQQAIQLGAVGFIPKSAGLDTITDAVRQILEGDIWLPAGLSIEQTNQDTETQQFIARLALLTPHQLKVLRYMADGLLNKQIAHEMDISESTVKQHASAVLKKLQVINRTKAGVLYKQCSDVLE